MEAGPFFSCCVVYCRRQPKAHNPINNVVHVNRLVWCLDWRAPHSTDKSFTLISSFQDLVLSLEIIGVLLVRPSWVCREEVTWVFVWECRKKKKVRKYKGAAFRMENSELTLNVKMTSLCVFLFILKKKLNHFKVHWCQFLTFCNWCFEGKFL